MRDTIKWSGIKGKIDEEMILCVEKILDIKFPLEYVECIKLYPRGRPTPSFFKTNRDTTYYGENGGGDFEYFYDFNPKSKFYILNQYHAINNHSGCFSKVPDGIVPFASASGNHDELCFDYREGYPPKIVLMDDVIYGDYLAYLEDSDECEEVTEEDYLIFVCDSFGELLDMLEEASKED